MASVFEQMNSGALGGSLGAGGEKGKDSIPLLAAVIKLKDSKGGVLESFSSKGFGTGSPDAFSLFRETKFSGLWKNGAPTSTSLVSNTSDIGAPASWVSRTSGSGSGMERS